MSKADDGNTRVWVWSVHFIIEVAEIITFNKKAVCHVKCNQNLFNDKTIK